MNPSHIIDMACTFYDSCILFTASDLNLFATLAELKKANAETIANACSLNKRGAQLLLNACTAIGLLYKNGETYSNTEETAMFLVPGAPGDLSGAIRYNRDVFPVWGRLKEMIKTGNPVEKPEIHLGEDRDRTRTFVLSMHSRAVGIGRLVVPLLELDGRKKLFDVGGGPGTYSMLIAQANSNIICTVLDLPEVIKVAEELINKNRVSDRVKTIAGDYHNTPFPNDNDVVNFFGVLHQESPDSICDLLQKTYNSLKPGGLIYILDMMTDSSHTFPKFSALFAVNMALTTKNGWVFSKKELSGWMHDVGFINFSCRTLPPPMPHWLAVAKKP